MARPISGCSRWRWRSWHENGRRRNYRHAGGRTEVVMRLRTLLGDHPGTAALKNGSVKSDAVELDFVDYSPAHKGFKPMVRDAAFDVSELAIVTFLMAKSFGKPMVLLPNVVVARSQHGYALYNARHGTLKTADPNGKRVGIRSFT